MPRIAYVTLRLPKSLFVEVDELVLEGTMGFRSRAEFVADAIRRRLENLGFSRSGKRRKKE